MIKMGWLKKRFREVDRTWWYVGYAHSRNNKMEVCGIIYTLSTAHFVLPSVLRDLEKRTGAEVVTILAWHQLSPKEGTSLARYFQARLDEIAAKAREAGDPKPAPHLALVKMEDDK